jgi:hypothetical protein
MPPHLPALYELQLTITGAFFEGYQIRYRLLDHRVYPPPPRLEKDHIVFDDDFREIASSIAPLPRIDGSGLAQLPLGFPPEASYRRIDQATRLLFQGEGMEMLRFMLEGTATIDDNLSQHARLGRLTLYIDRPELRKLRWESLGIIAGGEWVEFGRRFMILRRHRSLAGQFSGTLDLPLNVAIKSNTDRVPAEQVADYADSMFDSFTREARKEQGIVWGEMGVGAEPGEAHHLVFDQDDTTSRNGLTSDLYSMVQRRSLIRQHGAETIVPRLLVLHSISAPKNDYPLHEYVDIAIDQGADAVLLAMLPSAQPDAGAFFSTFYRKLMHNWPLDQCVLAARLEAHKNGLPVDTIFGAREEGELSLLLSRAIIEPVSLDVKPPDVIKAPRQTMPESKRSARSKSFGARLAKRTRQAVKVDRELIENTSARARELQFDQELHGVREAVRARAAMRSATRAVESAEAVAAEITEVKAEDTLRLTNLWLTAGKRKARAVAPNEALIAGKKYFLHLQIGQRRIEALVAEAFPDEKLREIFKTEESVTLDVMFFAPKTDFELKSRKARIKLPRHGNSDEIALPLVPLLLGARRIRACIYYQNTMLQSIVLETSVIGADDAPSRNEEKPVTSTVIDYYALTDISAERNLPPPVVNIFTNEAPDGTHWIGIFSSGDTASTPLRSGDMHTFSTGRLKTVAEQMRACLLKVEGDDNEGFKYISPVPDEDEIADREKDLCTLALEGRLLYQSLFQGAEQPLPVNRQKTFKNELTNQGSIVSVARCRSEGITIPWASLYTLHIDTDKKDQMSVCPLFKDQLKANIWSNDQTNLIEKHDLLDDPVACRNQPACPLEDKKRSRVTVCPFGFWGFLHQIEQPLQQVTPTPSDQVPPELKDPKIQTSFLSRAPNEALKLVCGVYSHLEGAEEHRKEIKNIKFTSLTVDDTEDRDHVLELLEDGGWHVYYFYCHGEIENSTFRLKLGLEDDPHYLGAADLDVTEIEWPDQPMPLVFINGCETMAVLPEQIHDFLSVLRQLGVSGVIGTEVKVWTSLARPFGNMVLNHILGGKSVGETFLEIRKNMLRRYNPLGLLYNYYSPANLHLHDPAACGWCATHKQAAAGGG